MENPKCYHSGGCDFCFHEVLDNYRACDPDTPCHFFGRVLLKRAILGQQTDSSIHIEKCTENADVRNIDGKCYLGRYYIPRYWRRKNDDSSYVDVYRDKACDICTERICLEES